MDKTKKAILAVSYGSSLAAAREKTIDIIEKELADAFPDRKLYRAWTSEFMRKRAKEQDGLSVPNLAEVIDQMRKDGIEDVVVEPVFVACASEYQKVIDAFKQSADAFSQVCIGMPLLGSDEDLKTVAALLPNLEGNPEMVPDSERMQGTDPEGTPLSKDAIVFMAHGSSSMPESNQIFMELADELKRQKLENVLIGTIDGAPGFDFIPETLREKEPGKVILMPFLLAAGSHVIRDMSSDREGSWKNRLEAEGFQVEAIPKGLAEYEEIRQIFVKHALDV
ncbi:MAG: sirohydrochlorin cobaltochelatase [Eubacterium sp.]|nr:sirohydrochlorin cobaltochelatase [Eubacterium sp.]